MVHATGIFIVFLRIIGLVQAAVTTGENEKGFTEIVDPKVNNLLAAEIVTKGAYTLLMMMKNKSE